jgi:predicted RNase H-like HicB family nuclease
LVCERRYPELRQLARLLGAEQLAWAAHLEVCLSQGKAVVVALQQLQTLQGVWSASLAQQEALPRVLAAAHASA